MMPSIEFDFATIENRAHTIAFATAKMRFERFLATQMVNDPIGRYRLPGGFWIICWQCLGHAYRTGIFDPVENKAISIDYPSTREAKDAFVSLVQQAIAYEYSPVKPQKFMIMGAKNN